MQVRYDFSEKISFKAFKDSVLYLLTLDDKFSFDITFSNMIVSVTRNEHSDFTITVLCRYDSSARLCRPDNTKSMDLDFFHTLYGKNGGNNITYKECDVSQMLSDVSTIVKFLMMSDKALSIS